MNKALLILLISCSQDVWLPIWSMYWISWHSEILYNYEQCHQDPYQPSCRSSCRHIFFPWWNFVHLRRAIEFSLVLGWVTMQTLTQTMLDMLVVLPIYFIRSDAKNFYVTRQPTSTRTLVNGFAYILCHRYYFPYLMAELFHMYDIANEPVLDHNVSCSIQNWSIFWPSSSSDWQQCNFLITQTIVMWYSEV